MILSIGGETYWGSSAAYNINYQQIKDLVDDMGFAGIDWDFEPNGSFADIGNTANVQHFVDFINNSRALMPKNNGYIIACAPSGAGALGGLTNDDATSPFKYANRNTLTGETDVNLYQATTVTNGISLFGFGATGHMIPVMQQVGDKIDLIAFQGYNCGASTNRSIMYDAYAYYAEKYGFMIAAGVHYPSEPWGPYYDYTHTNVASLASHIKSLPSRTDNNDGVMIWELLLENTTLKSSAYSYVHTASLVFEGSTEVDAIKNATSFTSAPYVGGGQGCSTTIGGGNTTYCGTELYKASNQYPTPNTKVYYQCKLWSNKWYANPNEMPGTNAVWAFESNCSEGQGCTTSMNYQSIASDDFSIYPNPTNGKFTINLPNENSEITIADILGQPIMTVYPLQKTVDLGLDKSGVYLIYIKTKEYLKILKLNVTR